MELAGWAVDPRGLVYPSQADSTKLVKGVLCIKWYLGEATRPGAGLTDPLLNRPICLPWVQFRKGNSGRAFCNAMHVFVRLMGNIESGGDARYRNIRDSNPQVQHLLVEGGETFLEWCGWARVGTTLYFAPDNDLKVPMLLAISRALLAKYS